MIVGRLYVQFALMIMALVSAIMRLYNFKKIASVHSCLIFLCGLKGFKVLFVLKQ